MSGGIASVFHSKQGSRLDARKWLPEDLSKAKALIFLAHGYAHHIEYVETNPKKSAHRHLYLRQQVYVCSNPCLHLSGKIYLYLPIFVLNLCFPEVLESN